MQNFNFYSVYDSAIEEFLPPFSAKNDKIAIRIFETAKDQKNIVLEDLTLFSLGSLSLDNSHCDANSNLKSLAAFVNGQMIVLNEVNANG